jgi:hypothetical protein
MTVEMHKALIERRELIRQRADAVLDQALMERQDWVLSVGGEPAEIEAAASWRRQARTIAAYRDRYDITGNEPLGAAPASDAQKIDAARANAALVRLKHINTQRTKDDATQPSQRRSGTGRVL